MSNTHEEARECGHESQYCDKCSTFISALLAARDQKHQREVEELREAIEESKRRLGMQGCIDCRGINICQYHRAKLWGWGKAWTAFKETRRKQLAEEEGGKE